MNSIKNILGRIFATWFAVLFVTTLLIFIIPICITMLFPEPRGTEIFRRISKLWMDIFLFLTGCPIKILGKNKFVKGQNYIVTTNHNSMMDIMITTPQIPGPNKTIAKIELSRIPIFGLIYKRGSVLVDRKNEASRKESFNKMKEVLQLGMHMCIYPEGTRNKTSEPLKSFHEGAFKLAVDTGVPIMPALLFNTKKAMPQNKTFFIWPTKMEIHFLTPVFPTPGETSTQLKDKIFQLMSDYYAAHENRV
ncbi:MAG: 1-acyl-sn-glycerol-3-phosphate acyltransferase [Bacteroidetes bacterium]|nr:MAG: 1-acyl-sn-glycerol-3-phosphate acyltransferase [Bacteroidota bacterium]